MKKNILLLMAVTLLCNMTTITAQNSREYIRNQIKYQGNCRNVAITKTNGDLMLYGKNGWASSGCPTGLTNALNELNEANEFIDDVQLTESGRWLILYGNNGFRWSNIPYSLEQKIREANDDGEIITSVTFNDDGDWIMITASYYCSSDYRCSEWLQEGNEKFGQLWAACVTDDAIVAVYKNGYQFLGNVPEDLMLELKNTSMDVYRLKIAGNAWFIADIDGHYNYNM